MTTPAPVSPTPPATPGPAPTSDAAELLAIAAKHWALLVKAFGAFSLVFGAWTALSGRVEHVEAAGRATDASVAQVREEARAEAVRTQAQLRELDHSREEHAKALVRLESRLDAMEKTLDRVDRGTSLILDRLGDPAPAPRRGVAASTP